MDAMYTTNPERGYFKLKNDVGIVLSSFSGGQGNAGVALAPSEIYNAGLNGLIRAMGREPLTPSIATPPEADVKSVENIEGYNIKGLSTLGPMLEGTYQCCRKYIQDSIFTLNIGGDHSVAIGSMGAALEKYPDLCVVWVDAHADAQIPEKSESGNYHGMVLAHCMGWFRDVPGFEWLKNRLDQKNVVYYGLRDIDEFERERLRKENMTYYAMRDIDNIGIATALSEGMRRVNPDGKRPVHISFDVDSADPEVAPGTGTKCKGGMSWRECLRVVEFIRERYTLVSMDIVEVDVELDVMEPPLHGDETTIETPYKTVKFALHLIRAALGYIDI